MRITRITIRRTGRGWEALGDDGDKFNITATGQLVFKSAPDFEARGSKAGDNNYKVTVKATVGDSSHQLDVVVKVYDVNEAPVIGQTDTNYPHEENDASSVATFTATDEDAGDTVTGPSPAMTMAILTCTRIRAY